MAKKRYPFAWSPLRNLMLKAGAEIVSKDAIITLMNFLEDHVKKVTSMAMTLAKHSKRKKIQQSDIILALEYKK